MLSWQFSLWMTVDLRLRQLLVIQSLMLLWRQGNHYIFLCS
uniref:Uncharacterized protein n=1 Tax=Arundo donax TaxID=35708 RepID=A0A0A9GU47_ARUDO